MTDTYARCTRIDLDGKELPKTLHLSLSADVRDRVLADFPLWTVGRHNNWFETKLSIGEAADMARHFGRITGLDEPRTEFYYCITNIINSFWENGIGEAPTAGLVAKSSEAAE